MLVAAPDEKAKPPRPPRTASSRNNRGRDCSGAGVCALATGRALLLVALGIGEGGHRRQAWAVSSSPGVAGATPRRVRLGHADRWGRSALGEFGPDRHEVGSSCPPLPSLSSAVLPLRGAGGGSGHGRRADPAPFGGVPVIFNRDPEPRIRDLRQGGSSRLMPAVGLGAVALGGGADTPDASGLARHQTGADWLARPAHLKRVAFIPRCALSR